jgi:hypothetical protein
MLTALSCLASFYCGAFVVLYVRARAKPGRTSRAPEPTSRTIPWNGHLFTEAPTDAEVADLFLKKDIELAGRGQ